MGAVASQRGGFWLEHDRILQLGPHARDVQLGVFVHAQLYRRIGYAYYHIFIIEVSPKVARGRKDHGKFLRLQL